MRLFADFMIPQGPRRLGYYAGKKWFQWAVLIVLCGLIVLGLIDALEDAKARAERQAVELTVRNMRTGMQLAMGEALMQQRQAEIASWAGSNPTIWLGTTPRGYQGQCETVEGKVPDVGGWCFAAEQKTLVYRPRSATLMHGTDRLGGQVCALLRWRVMRAPSAAALADSGFVGLRIEAIEGCR